MKKIKMPKYLIYVINFGVLKPNEKSNANSLNGNPTQQKPIAKELTLG
jgi:hypothetical protein